MKTALVTGAGGQDGSYAVELLLKRGYRVFGTVRDNGVGHSSASSSGEFEPVPWAMADQDRMADTLRKVKPSEMFNFAAYSSGAGMFDDPVAIGDVNGLAVGRMLEAIRQADHTIRFCQASSSEMFGEPAESPQSEETRFRPRSPYGAAKLYAHSMIDIYRKRYGLFACSAILFNHESPRRGLAFVSRKVTHSVASIKLGLISHLNLGNLEARRDWGFAGDYVHAMWRMLQAERPDDYVVATGRTHSVRELCELAFGHVDLDYRDHVREDADAFRAGEPVQLVGDSRKASTQLGWSPTITFPQLVRTMVDADIERLRLDP